MAQTTSSAARYSTNVRISRPQQWITYHFLRTLWYGMPGLTERLLETLFFAPKSYALSPEEQQCLAQGRPFAMRVHDKQIRAWQWGHGPGVLLVHGWNGRGIQFQRYIAPLVQAGYAPIALDGPAHGASQGRSTSYFEFSDTVRAFLRPEHGLNICGIVAHSFGAAAVINSLAHERFCLRVVLLAPALKLRELILHAFKQHGIPPVVYETMIARYEERFGYTLAGDNPHRLLKDLASQVLVIHDQDDPVIAHEDSLTVCQRFSHLTLHTTHGLGHRGVMTDPGVVQRVMEYLGDARVRTDPSHYGTAGLWPSVRCRF
jgi:pimeloyl-ACP methyl ester carboxylesterase